ncbi:MULTISPECIES: putative O-glycosylation ligase, exosortase A system-associated [unclassified Janthinobacterium]|uniref:putative O-glycosylation ligase, exosortase A system-associated n=1 Tax=unclassified Janthinobacterium TaxID=2610881 RepID=UPI00160CCBA2|nr:MULTISPECIES: putative O-glycosylation ligase, exosortase A system-associated [unclassified Janthinobacterium]MBB5606523.1 putative O-glycosylation ligase (exosortase A-associated) [Janthinobacterium sp. S3T4]MBB5611605.1 putative O-glycosylation ligase (exosortase A-associated) [Janthinobacterium sp. S3M3]
MRDILVTLVILGSLPFILKSPAVGGLMWVWVSVMNPHTQAWGFATHLPFAFIIAIATMFSLLISHGPKSLPLTSVSVLLLMFVAWMNITAPFALLPESSWVQWNKVMKIMLMSFVVMMVIRKRQDIVRLVWVLVGSIGYYGVKGGIFTIRSGGTERVWGPEETFIGDNNSLALALIITIPLMFYLQQNSDKRWLRHGLSAAMLLSALAALGSYSRGALLAIAAMCLFMWIKSGRKVALGAVLCLLTPLLLAFMPERWSERMESINTYQEDSSAQGRLNAWEMAWNLARDRFLGGGFDVSDPGIFARYAPNPMDVHAAHSIYFQVLGEHGFVGLAIYLALGIATWRAASGIIKLTRNAAELRWALGLATMIQASMIGFAVGGAFLSLLYFDMPYYLMAVLIATRIVVERQLLTGKVQP